MDKGSARGGVRCLCLGRWRWHEGLHKGAGWGAVLDEKEKLEIPVAFRNLLLFFCE